MSNSINSSELLNPILSDLEMSSKRIKKQVIYFKIKSEDNYSNQLEEVLSSISRFPLAVNVEHEFTVIKLNKRSLWRNICESGNVIGIRVYQSNEYFLDSDRLNVATSTELGKLSVVTVNIQQRYEKIINYIRKHKLEMQRNIRIYHSKLISEMDQKSKNSYDVLCILIIILECILEVHRFQSKLDGLDNYVERMKLKLQDDMSKVNALLTSMIEEFNDRS